MGTRENPIAGSGDMLHGNLFTQGIDVGVPCLSCHRGAEETSKIDVWNMLV